MIRQWNAAFHCAATKCENRILKREIPSLPAEELKMVGWAHKMLMDPEKRAQYYLKLKRAAFERALEEKRLQGESGPWWRSKVVIGVLVALVVLLAFIFARR